ncbi:MAG TPA: hypothetical protein PKC99_18340 [Anaerolineales bacterium]|nr:hypothetical protein [Anaerolineae bacterium]MBL1172578.1 hypothetical protein [Chloroflexota bacterium]MDL1926533.1 hypothetical protein [Anaerolineae bacterium AMX1]WKZ51302.1 MAG: hypothetical protein QY329_00950 [Anaerolineales bacterium]NOG76066.1 hypothetical protein [Chloroflexota bacterium]
MLRKIFRILIFLFLSGCATTSPPPTQPDVILSESACTKGDATINDQYQSPPNRIGGGEIQSDAFHFQLWLYCDTDLTPPEYKNEQSSIKGLGIWGSWDYQGEAIGGSIDIAFGPVPANMPTLSFDGGLTPKSSGAFHRGIEISQDDLYQSVQTNQPVRYEIRIQTEQGIYGATLSFMLQPADDGYLPVGIEIQGIE